jgi:hypothetical protein
VSAPDDERSDVTTWKASGAREMERHAARVFACEPAATLTRTRDAIQFDVDGPGCRVTLLVTAEALELRLPTVEWPAPHLPLESTRLWKRVRWTRLGDDAALRALIEAAFEKRRREFVPCRFCKEPTPPEHRHGRVCHGCAESRLGIVH